MALQGLTVECAFTTTPFADPSTLTWTDLSARALKFSMRRGRQYELTQMQAGSCTLVLKNLDGYLDPDNGSSPYSPNVLPMTPVRISATYGGTTYRLFYGFVESWQQQWDQAGPRFGTVTVTASDGLKAILSYAVGQGYTDKLVSDYGGTVGTANSAVWPWQAPNVHNYYDNAGTANVDYANASTVTGVAQTGLQFTGSSSYLRFLTGTFFTALDSWFRLDTVPSSGQTCLFYNGGGTQTNPCAFGYGAPTCGDDAMSVWAINTPQNLLPTNAANPTSTTGWTLSTGGTIATATGTTSNLLSRIWTDTGATDLYGATSVMKASITNGSTSLSLSAPSATASASTAYTFSVVYTDSRATTSVITLYADWYNGATLLSSTQVSTGTPTTNVPMQMIGTATAPANTTNVVLRINLTSNNASWNFQVGQLLMWSGSYPSTQGVVWWAPSVTQPTQLMIVVGTGSQIAPPGQTAGTYGWACYATTTVPTAGTWFHVGIDVGRDNGGSPYVSSFQSQRMPAVWVNGATVRMWTTGTSSTGWNAAPISSIGAKFTNYSSPTLYTASCTACTVDETYIPGAISTTGEVTAAQASAHYNYGLVRHDFVQQDTGSRVGAVLDSLSWPTALRTVDTGTVNILAQLPDTSSTSQTLTGLSCIQDANTVEGGLYYVARDGTFTFWNRTHTMPSVSITFGDNGTTEIPYQHGVTTSKDDTYIYNLVQLTQKITDGSGGTALFAQAFDSTSQARYKVRASPTLNAPWVQQSDMTTLASAIVTDYKNPQTRIASVSVNAVTATTPANVFASLLPRDIGDKVTVNVRPVGGAPQVAVSAYVQGVSLSVDPQSWVFTFSLSPTLTGH